MSLLTSCVGVAALSALAAAPIPLSVAGCDYVFHPETGLLALRAGEVEVPLLRGVGPVWEVDGAEHSWADADVRLIETVRGEQTVRCRYSGAPGDVRWQLLLRAGGPDGEPDRLLFVLTSDDPRITGASPGLVVAGGPWTGLDLSQYQLAHGQTNWPKTYFLREQALFLCAYWDWEVSGASGPDWPTDQCEPRQGEGPFAPAATMGYTPYENGEREPLREGLSLRVAPRLWDAALPSLCRPSEHRREMAEMVYLDLWGAEPADQMLHLLSVLARLAGPHVRFLTIVQNWQAGGFDSLLPDSVWLPDYPPNPAVGGVEDLRALAEAGNRLGRLGFRTNYVLLRRNSPSFLHGLAHFALGADGKPTWHTAPADWETVAARQEREIAGLWQPAAAFTDQITSGGGPWAWLDFRGAPGGHGSLSVALKAQRALARLIKDAHDGPVGSETLNHQDLIGYYFDFGDFGIMDGHHRLFPPDYKLRRLQEVTVSYGCGLPYRFFELPPFKLFHSNRLDLWSDPGLMDDYRCCEVMLGNGAYVFWRSPWAWALTECLLVGRLQRHYALVPVVAVEYRVGDAWRTLEDLIREGFACQTRPWNQKQAEFGRVRVRYANGFTVIVNRLPEDFAVETPAGGLDLPQYGWVAFMPGGAPLAYSAYRPGTRERVDYLDEGPSGLRFLNPRGQRIEGSRRLRLWSEGRVVWSVDPEQRMAYVNGEEVPLDPPAPEPLRDLRFDFGTGLGGWRPVAGILQVQSTGEATILTLCDPDPQLYSPPLALEGRAGDVLELTMATDAGELGQLYFATPEDGISERQVIRFPLQPDGAVHTLALPVGEHDRWVGTRITLLRLDPVHGPEQGTVKLRSLQLRRAEEEE